MTSFWDHVSEKHFPSKRSPATICFLRKWNNVLKLCPQKSDIASFAHEIKVAACLLGGRLCGGRHSRCGSEASQVPRFPPALPFCVASLVQGAGVSDSCPTIGHRCLSSVSDLGTCLTRFWLFCFNLCLVVCGTGPSAISDTEILRKNAACACEEGNPGKRFQDCSSAPLARARSGSKAQGRYAVNAPCLSVLSYASSSNWRPGPSIQMVGALCRTMIHGPEIWLYIF